MTTVPLHSYRCDSPDGTDTCARCRLPYEDPVHFQDYADMVARRTA